MISSRIFKIISITEKLTVLKLHPESTFRLSFPWSVLFAVVRDSAGDTGTSSNRCAFCWSGDLVFYAEAGESVVNCTPQPAWYLVCLDARGLQRVTQAVRRW